MSFHHRCRRQNHLGWSRGKDCVALHKLGSILRFVYRHGRFAAEAKIFQSMEPTFEDADAVLVAHSQLACLVIESLLRPYQLGVSGLVEARSGVLLRCKAGISKQVLWPAEKLVVLTADVRVRY